MWLRINLHQEYSSIFLPILQILLYISHIHASLFPGDALPSFISADPPEPPALTLTPKLIKNVESKLLTILGLAVRPKPDRRKVTIPEYMLQLYREQLKTNVDPDWMEKEKGSRKGRRPPPANTIRSFTHQESESLTFPLHGHKEHLLFNLSLPHDEDIKAADLRLSLPHSPTTPPRLLILIHQILRPHPRDPITRALDSQLVEVNRSRSVTFDILPAVQHWRHFPEENFGLEVEILTPDGRGVAWEVEIPEGVEVVNPLRKRRFVRAAERGTGEFTRGREPLMVVYSDDPRAPKPTKTPRRSNSRQGTQVSRNRDPCRRQNLYVDFSDVGWNDWIVAPPGYQAFYCAGQCTFPLPDHLNVTNHALVQTLVNNVNKGAVPQVCCIPTELSPISLLYLDEHEKVVLKNYQDMVVEGCGCR